MPKPPFSNITQKFGNLLNICKDMCRKGYNCYYIKEKDNDKGSQEDVRCHIKNTINIKSNEEKAEKGETLDQMEKLLLDLTQGKYKAEKHYVYTVDGYRLNLYRIVNNNRENIINDKVLQKERINEQVLEEDKKEVFCLNHGLFESSINYTCKGYNSLTFQIFSNNHDVWISNNRGNNFTQYVGKDIAINKLRENYTEEDLRDLGLNIKSDQIEKEMRKKKKKRKKKDNNINQCDNKNMYHFKILHKLFFQTIKYIYPKKNNFTYYMKNFLMSKYLCNYYMNSSNKNCFNHYDGENIDLHKKKKIIIINKKKKINNKKKKNNNNNNNNNNNSHLIFRPLANNNFFNICVRNINEKKKGNIYFKATQEREDANIKRGGTLDCDKIKEKESSEYFGHKNKLKDKSSNLIDNCDNKINKYDYNDDDNDDNDDDNDDNDDNDDDNDVEYTFEDMSTKDLPCIIKYIKNKTKKDKIIYVGFSQGSIQLLISSCLNEYVRKSIKRCYLMSLPIILRNKYNLEIPMKFLLYISKYYSFVFKGKSFFQHMIPYHISTFIISNLAHIIAHHVFKYYNENIKPEEKKLFFYHTPNGSTSKANLTRWAKAFNTCPVTDVLEKYPHECPFPITLIYGNKDTIIHVDKSIKYMNKIFDGKYLKIITVPNWAHLDPLWSDNHGIVISCILKDINRGD
ncbi:steryl ester hydrolase, putative [Plasmodium reichenowi]|uniref:Steryl ester hydrolase, putative n=1 Tax=Plasmodium reichenowi TaxID=5854 RepID=A0A060RZZ2_PLARE|nr:steryl ester hydrolase, putative [Plasmodium reichenowi]